MLGSKYRTLPIPIHFHPAMPYPPGDRKDDLIRRIDELVEELVGLLANCADPQEATLSAVTAVTSAVAANDCAVKAFLERVLA